MLRAQLFFKFCKPKQRKLGWHPMSLKPSISLKTKHRRTMHSKGAFRWALACQHNTALAHVAADGWVFL